ncbi:DUF3499 domain-containing protein [Ornithinimicrobium cavernae]|uniref:DUF3499 domain-containing protein n=1 Tax=Ornithinimicrobium cavernae TaxID=2666047 RepID=UPI000D696203|nr:DUF3499 domain-containing protein [Ornithinimicrobium cavernae]
MAISRQCSKTACGNSAFATLTYVYAEQTAVLGPLATYAEPHSYDLCDDHARRLTAPRGWDIVRLEMGEEPPDDLVALAEAVREHRAHSGDPASRPLRPAEATVTEIGRRGHLRLLRDR